MNKPEITLEVEHMTAQELIDYCEKLFWINLEEQDIDHPDE